MSVPTTTVTNVQRLKLDLPEGQLVKQKIKELAAFINEEKFQADRIARLVGKQWRGVVCGMLEAKIKGQEMGYLFMLMEHPFLGCSLHLISWKHICIFHQELPSFHRLGLLAGSWPNEVRTVKRVGLGSGVAGFSGVSPSIKGSCPKVPMNYRLFQKLPNWQLTEARFRHRIWVDDGRFMFLLVSILLEDGPIWFIMIESTSLLWSGVEYLVL